MKDLISICSDFLPTKSNIEALANNISELANNGEVDVLKLAVQLTAVAKACEQAKEKLNEAILTELDKHGKGTEVLGAKVEKKEVGTKWDYSQSEAWVAVKKREDNVAEQRKAIEQIAKNVPEGSEMQYTDMETGETLVVKRGVKTSKSSFAVTLGK